jgi:hypothetical protein
MAEDNEAAQRELAKLPLDEYPVFMPARWDMSQLNLEHVL